MGHLFWLNDKTWAQIEPHLPINQPGARRVDDRRVISGINSTDSNIANENHGTRLFLIFSDAVGATDLATGVKLSLLRLKDKHIVAQVCI